MAVERPELATRHQRRRNQERIYPSNPVRPKPAGFDQIQSFLRVRYLSHRQAVKVVYYLVAGA